MKIPLLIVIALFPGEAKKNVEEHVSYVWQAMEEVGLDDRDMKLMALATIRAETEVFLPVSEHKSRHNTRTYPFDRYEQDRLGKQLGNLLEGDGRRYRGRGYIQLTGRRNYERMGKALGVDLVRYPELANSPPVSAKILAAFLKEKEPLIRQALERDDLRTARKIVNGGGHGMDAFVRTFRRGERLLDVRLVI